MSLRFSTVLFEPSQANQAFTNAWKRVKPFVFAGHRFSFEIKPETRSTAQNRMMWAILGDLAEQVQWPVDGKLQKLAPDEWKHILSAGLKKHQRVAQGIEGGFVMLGQPTSRMTVGEMGDLITLAHAFGDERGVKWSRTSLGRDVPDEVAA
jgi:hypothetical protein